MTTQATTPKRGGEVSFTVPGTPPSVNHYRGMRNGKYFVRREASEFKKAIAFCARRQYIAAKEYEIELHIFLGHKQRLDLDNGAKVAIDGLVAAGVIHTDSAVTRLVMEKARDAKNPRTEITVRAM